MRHARFLALLLAVFPFRLHGQDQTTPSKASPQTNASKPHAAVEYVNNEYGFRFALPDSWKGYKIVQDEWGGGNGGTDGKVPERGPILVIRNPRWTDDRPTQDIPIMIFMLAQWKKVENDELIVSAAPIGPGELGRNRKYVFALPPRFSYADVDEKEEVEELVRHNPLKAF